MIELKATLESGTQVSISASAPAVITLRRPSHDQREPGDDIMRFPVKEWNEIKVVVQELVIMMGADGDKVSRPPLGLERPG